MATGLSLTTPNSDVIVVVLVVVVVVDANNSKKWIKETRITLAATQTLRGTQA